MRPGEVEIYLIAKSQPKRATADVFGLSVGLFFFGGSDSVLGPKSRICARNLNRMSGQRSQHHRQCNHRPPRQPIPFLVSWLGTDLAVSVRTFQLRFAVTTKVHKFNADFGKRCDNVGFVCQVLNTLGTPWSSYKIVGHFVRPLPKLPPTNPLHTHLISSSSGSVKFYAFPCWHLSLVHCVNSAAECTMADCTLVSFFFYSTR